jgi:hypothetical protein
VKKFGELGVKQADGRKLFNCQQVSITDVVNCEIEVLDYIPDMTTKHGPGRYLVHYRQEGAEGKFFSNSTNIKSALDQIPREEFPFITIVKATKCGSGKIFQFT